MHKQTTMIFKQHNNTSNNIPLKYCLHSYKRNTTSYTVRARVARARVFFIILLKIFVPELCKTKTTQFYIVFARIL